MVDFCRFRAEGSKTRKNIARIAKIDFSNPMIAITDFGESQLLQSDRFRQSEQYFLILGLGSCGPGKLTEKGKFPKVLGGGCKRSFGAREQGSPKSLLHHPKLLLHRCNMGFWVVQKTFRRPLLAGSKRPFAPSPNHFWEFSLSGQFPRPAASQF